MSSSLYLWTNSRERSFLDSEELNLGLRKTGFKQTGLVSIRKEALGVPGGLESPSVYGASQALFSFATKDGTRAHLNEVRIGSSRGFAQFLSLRFNIELPYRVYSAFGEETNPHQNPPRISSGDNLVNFPDKDPNTGLIWLVDMLSPEEARLLRDSKYTIQLSELVASGKFHGIKGRCTLFE
jgi:hypothetical protein